MSVGLNDVEGLEWGIMSGQKSDAEEDGQRIGRYPDTPDFAGFL